MIIHHNLQLTIPVHQSVVTMGSFDGVHLGHRKILEKVVHIAEQSGLESVLITFSQHPRKVLGKQAESLKLLTTSEERRDIFEEIGIRHLVCLTFDQELASMEAEDFIRNILINHLNARYIITGYGHRFGKGGRGDHELLDHYAGVYGYTAELIPMQDIESNMISSTLIRQLLEQGDVSGARDHLGYAYRLSGEVMGGSRIGQTLGFPTANIGNLHPEKLIPADGVYAVKGYLEGRVYGGMMNIGYRPTVDGSVKTLEVHLFGFGEDAYGKKLTVSFEHRLRDEMKFASLEELQEQLTRDRRKALRLIG
jgi:riboflavin kinase / FMN adenylyltransferase